MGTEVTKKNQQKNRNEETICNFKYKNNLILNPSLKDFT